MCGKEVKNINENKNVFLYLIWNFYSFLVVLRFLIDVCDLD